jgi:hypothetical protein
MLVINIARVGSRVYGRIGKFFINLFDLTLYTGKYLNKNDVKDRFKVKTKRGRKSGREKFGKALDKPDLSPIKADKADKASKNTKQNTEPTRKSTRKK